MDTPLPNSQALPAGTRLEEFMIERVLGSGGFGITYLARDTALSRQVVIKENLPVQFCFRDTHSLTIAPRHTHGDDAESFRWSLENFSREAEMLASLHHPGIVPVLRRFETFGTAYFVMPYVGGVPFDTLIEERHLKKKPFSEEELRGLLERMLDALTYLHARGIYHRDIKPANLLISNDGIPVLIDFGAARQKISERSMTVIESAGYTPFEQHQSRGNVGPWSDLYALGGTLVKAITGQAPPKAADRVMDDPWPGFSSNTRIFTHYSSAFLSSIERALAPSPSHRWQDAQQWKHYLQTDIPVSVTAEMPQPVHPVSHVPTEASKSKPYPVRASKNKTNAVPWILAACLVIVLIAVLSNRQPRGKEDSHAVTVADEAAIQRERDKVEAATEQARAAEQRAAQAERDKQTLIEEARIRELKQGANQAENEQKAHIEQVKAREKAEADEKQRVADAVRESAVPGERSNAMQRPEIVAVPSTPSSRTTTGAYAKEVQIMQESIRRGQIKEFTAAQVLNWHAGQPEDLDGKVYQTGIATYKAETIFGVKNIQAKALIRNGRVTKWVWPKSGVEIK